MAHWAEIDHNGIVQRVLVGDNNDPNGDEGYQWLVDNLGGTWVKTSYNAATNGFRKNYAGIGYSYDANRDAFIAPKPECHPDTVIFNEETCVWSCPDASHIIIIGEENV
jgi:hypothetical protein